MNALVAALVVLLAAPAETVPYPYAPRAACWRSDGLTRVAALSGDALRLGELVDGEVVDRGAHEAGGVTSLAALDGHGLYGAQGRRVVRRRGAWELVAELPDAVLQLLPCDVPPGLVVLHGTPGGTPPAAATLAWLPAGGRPVELPQVPARWRAWKLGWAAAGGQRRLVVSTHKSTRFLPFDHDCLFVFDWLAAGPALVKRWLGSRLSRPYLDAAHADLRGDGEQRLAAVEVAADGGRGMTVYRPIGFGYEGEWRGPGVEGLERVIGLGRRLLAWGRVAGRPAAWELVPDGEGYRLDPRPAPAGPMDWTIAADGTMIWFEDGWHVEQPR